MPDARSSRRTPRDCVHDACGELGEAEVARRCAALLRGIDPADDEDLLRRLGFTAELAWLTGAPNRYWARVWGARALRYCWHDSATADVLGGLRDDAWRVVEHCAVIVAIRELPDAAPTLVGLPEHPVPRVRAAAVRALSRVGEHEDVPAVVRLADDPERIVRAAVEKARLVLGERLDLDLVP